MTAKKKHNKDKKLHNSAEKLHDPNINCSCERPNKLRDEL